MSVRRKQRLLLVIGSVFLLIVLFMFVRLSNQDFDDDFIEDANDFKIRLLKEIELELGHHRETNNDVRFCLDSF